MQAGRHLSGQCSYITGRVASNSFGISSGQLCFLATLPGPLERSALAIRQTCSTRLACLHEEEHHFARDVAADAVHVHVALASHPALRRQESTHTPFTLRLGAPLVHT